MCNRIGICLMGFVACLVLTAVWAVVAAPGTALGKPPRAQQDSLTVDLRPDYEKLPFPSSPLWAPAASARTVGTGPAKYHFLFDNDQNAEFVTSDGKELVLGVGCSVYLNKDGCVSGLMVRGRDVYGILHVSYDSATDDTVLPIVPAVDPAKHTDANGVFTLHVDRDGIEIWKTAKKGLEEMVGTISIADIVFTPQP